MRVETGGRGGEGLGWLCGLREASASGFPVQVESAGRLCGSGGGQVFYPIDGPSGFIVSTTARSRL